MTVYTSHICDRNVCYIGHIYMCIYHPNIYDHIYVITWPTFRDRIYVCVLAVSSSETVKHIQAHICGHIWGGVFHVITYMRIRSACLVLLIWLPHMCDGIMHICAHICDGIWYILHVYVQYMGTYM